MRISGTEPSSLILSQTCSIKSWKVITQKCQIKQAEAKRDGVINPQNYNFNQFKTRKILMLSERYESTKVDRRTWLHLPSGTHWLTSSDTHQVVEIQIETLNNWCIHHFKSDLIYNMDHKRISGTEPSSVILIQTCIVSKVEKQLPKSAKTSWSQKGWCNKPTKLQFQSLLNTENFDALQTLQINRSRL